MRTTTAAPGLLQEEGREENAICFLYRCPIIRDAVCSVTINQLIRTAVERGLQASDVEAVARSLGVSPPDVCDVLSRAVATRFLAGELSWEVADAAMNSLFAYATHVREIELPAVFWRVYAAFDEGEFEHPGEPQEFQGENRTRVLLRWALTADDAELTPFRNDAKRARVRAAAAAIARRALDGQTSPVLAARELMALRSDADVADDDEEFLVFASIDSRTDSLPIGSVREHWNPDALAEKDTEIEVAEVWAREVGEPAFRKIVLRFGNAGQES